MSTDPTYRTAAWFQIAVGTAVVAWWAVAAATNGIVELEQGRTDIVFHIAAELLMAWLLISAGTLLLQRGTTAATTILTGVALGALMYSSINSPGYFAERGAWWAVGLFVALAAAAAVVAITLATCGMPPRAERRPRSGRRLGLRSSTMTERPHGLDTNRRIANAP